MAGITAFSRAARTGSSTRRSALKQKGFLPLSPRADHPARTIPRGPNCHPLDTWNLLPYFEAGWAKGSQLRTLLKNPTNASTMLSMNGKKFQYFQPSFVRPFDKLRASSEVLEG